MGKPLYIIASFFLILLAGCASANQSTPAELTADLSSTVEAPQAEPTLETVATQSPAVESTATIPPTPQDAYGMVSGKLCYPSEFIPEMTVYLQNIATGTVEQIITHQNQATYSLFAPGGQYHAFAYVNFIENGLAGGYTAAVPCGLGVDCADHSLLVVDALPGQETLGVDICDWYAPEQMPARPDPTPDALAGLIYTDVDASQVMQIDHLGEPRKLVTGLNAAIHPNGGQAIVEHDDDLWIVQLASGEERNLTNSTDRGEGSPAWWQANPDLIVFNSWPLSDPAVMSYGALSTIRSDGSEYIVLSEQFSLGKYALSPDGRTIAYDQGGIPWLYDVGSGSRPLDVAEYGYQPGGNFVAASPAFSPDGRYLAWWTGSGDHADGSYRFELLVLDLAENSHQVLHSFAPVGGSGGWFINPLFSPDGRWIAFTTKDEVSRSELYVSNLSGSEEHDLGLATDAIWSPEGSRLVYLSWSASADSYLAGEASGVNPGEWIPAAINLPPGAIPRAWQVLPPPIVN